MCRAKTGTDGEIVFGLSISNYSVWWYCWANSNTFSHIQIFHHKAPNFEIIPPHLYGTALFTKCLNACLRVFIFDVNYLAKLDKPMKTLWFACQLIFILEWVNTLGPRQNGRHFADDIFKCIFMNQNIWISIKISLKFVPKCPINNIPALVQIMAWRRPGDKPLSAPMMVKSTDAYMRHSASMC